MIYVILDYGESGGDGDIISDWWNNSWVAKLIPDVIYVNWGTAVTTLIGYGYSSGYALQIRGKEGFGIRPYETVTGKYGVHGTIGLNFGYASYSGDSRNFSFNKSFLGNGTVGYEVDYIFGMGIYQSPRSRSNPFERIKPPKAQPPCCAFLHLQNLTSKKCLFLKRKTTKLKRCTTSIKTTSVHTIALPTKMAMLLKTNKVKSRFFAPTLPSA